MQFRIVLPLAVSTLLVSTNLLHAQNPALAPDNLKATRQAMEKQAFTADCTLRMAPNRVEKFRYEHTPALDKSPKHDKITQPAAVFVRWNGQPWIISNDFGENGAPVAKAKATELDTMAGLTGAPFLNPDTQDKTQGGFVWRFVGRIPGKGYETFTYEGSREKPKKGGVYPRYTFIKRKGDKDGSLLLTDFRAPINNGKRVIPMTLHFSYAPPAAGASASPEAAASPSPAASPEASPSPTDSPSPTPKATPKSKKRKK